MMKAFEHLGATTAIELFGSKIANSAVFRQGVSTIALPL